MNEKEKAARPVTVAVLVPAYRPGQKFSRMLAMLQRQTMPVSQIVVMNTEKAFWNKEEYEKVPGLEVHHVTKKEFDHGATRRQGMGYVKTDVCLCMTDDAVPADRRLVENLVKALYPEQASPQIAAAYAKQLPDKDCRPIERYTRSFNYPAESQVKTKEDLPRLGIKTYFCSNVCAAYDMKIYRRLGGFVETAIFNEDMLYAAKAVGAGYGIAYAAEARVIHSHNYGFRQQIRRNFDLAVSQAQHPEVFAGIRSEGEGIRMVKKTARYLARTGRICLLPELVIGSGCKYLGYLLGKHYRMLPRGVILRLSSNRPYWERETR